MSMGWKPEEGFLPYNWDCYSELMLIYALAIGSPTYPIAPQCWNAWGRPKSTYGQHRFIYCPTNSLFVYQYSHAWIDFRKFRDKFGDYWANSVHATLASRQFCIDNKDKYKGFDQNTWGVSACLGPFGYKGYSVSPGSINCDGTIAPSSVAGSVPFAPEVCIPALRSMYDRFQDSVYGQYGFVNGFNIGEEWWAREFLGIDQGITLVMLENYRTGFVWDHFMKHPSIQQWIALCSIPETKQPEQQEEIE